MITAQEARNKTDEITKTKNDKLLSYLEGEILKAVNKGLCTINLYQKDFNVKDLRDIATSYGYDAQVERALDQRDVDRVKIIW